jgi:hypothetical protein
MSSAARQDGIDIGAGGIEIDDQRPDLGAQEMVRAGGTECASGAYRGVDELQHGGRIVEMTELAAALPINPRISASASRQWHALPSVEQA